MPEVDSLVPDPQAAREFGVSLMTLWRWDHDPITAALGWPAKTKIGPRNYRSRNGLETFKANVMRRGLRGGA